MRFPHHLLHVLVWSGAVRPFWTRAVAGVAVCALLLACAGGGGETSGGGNGGGGGTPSFSLSLGQSTGFAAPGQTFNLPLQVSPSSGFSAAINLAASNLPSGVSASFSPNPIQPGGLSSSCTFTVAAGAAPVTAQTVQLQAAGGGVTQTAAFTFSITNPNGPGFDLAVNAENVLLLPGATRELLVTLTPKNGYSGTVAFATAGLPTGVTSQFSNASLPLASGPVSTLLRLTAAASAPQGSSPATIAVNGQGPGHAAMTSLALRVAAAGDPVALRLGGIAAVEAKSRELRALNPAPLAYLQAIAAFMASRPEYKEAGVDTETLCAWGVFQDGTFHGVAANRDRDPNPFPQAVTHEVELPAAGGALLSQPKARLFHTFGSGFEGQQPVADMKGYLQGKGWTIRPGAEGLAYVETFRGIAGDGFLYINTHGGRIVAKGIGEPEDKLYAIQTSSLVSPANDLLYDADLKAFRLGPFTAPNGETAILNGQQVAVEDSRYAITYRFVQTYMSFTPGSVVWINACWSGRNTPFINAFLNKGASVYFGWSEKLSATAAYASAPYFVDRMLGANQHPTKESPAQRAFPWDLVLQDMTGKGLDTDLRNGGKLRATALVSQLPAIFAPSIRYAQVDEYEDKLILVGEFGTEAGKVTVAGTELAAQWAPDKITCTLPQSGPGSAGDIVVEVRNVKSNARQLTEWAVRVTYAWVSPGDNTGHKFEGSGTLRLRADIGGYRLKPGDSLAYKARGGSPTKDSSITVTASGSHTEGECTQTLSGTGVYVSPARLGGTPGTIIASSFKVDGRTRQGALGMGFGFVDSPHTLTLSGRDCSGSFPTAATMGFLEGIMDFPGDQSDDPPPGLILSGLQFTLDSNFGIPAKTKTASDFGGTLTVTLAATPAKFPPRDADDAGK